MQTAHQLPAPYRRASSHLQAALSFTALICWLLALYLPLARVEKLGIVNYGRLLQLGQSFRSNDQLLTGILVDLFAIALPSLLLALLPAITLARLAKRSFPAQAYAQRACSYAKLWAMPEVFALSILIAFIKLGSLAHASISTGFYFLAATVLLLTYLLSQVHLPAHPARKSNRAAGSFLLSACLLLIPANILPIMTVVTPGGARQSTILQGVANLASHGLWAIAAIVFFASILVPFGKIGGLLWLLRLSRSHSGSAHALQTYGILDFIGRWSMLDIFLIGVLAGLVDFGVLASIRPGPAAPAFAAAVILTIVAVERFDPKSLPIPTRPNLP